MTGPQPLTIGVFLPQPDQGSPPAERGTGRTVGAQWALWGKEARDLEYSLLRCSKGSFGPKDYTGILARYASGSNETLPQYTVCWIPGGSDGERYLAVAIHELADSRPGSDDGRARAAGGREIEYIRLFCVSYAEMAAQQVSYPELIHSVLGCQLTARPPDPVTVELLDTETPSFPAVGDLAENVAALLLTTRPVCVLGAGEVTAEERLRFVEQVMSLLPYGLRSQMSASTWASATAKNLNLRLFFAGAERDDGGATFHVTWDRPQRLDFSDSANASLRRYVNWLRLAGAGAAVELAGQPAPVRFDADEIREMISKLPSQKRPVADVLEELAEGLRHGQRTVVTAAVGRLRQRLNHPITPEQRDRYRGQIRRLDLLKEHPGLHWKTKESVYRVLLGLTVAPQVSYLGFCYLEDCIGGPPAETLGREMRKLKFLSFVPWLLTSRSAAHRTDQELIADLSAQGVRAAKPLDELSQRLGEMRPTHRAHAYDFAEKYLRDQSSDLKAQLEERGYLTQTLELAFPRDKAAQRDRLQAMLALVYGGLLTEEENAELRNRPGMLRTAAWHEAVDRQTNRPAPFFLERVIAVFKPDSKPRPPAPEARPARKPEAKRAMKGTTAVLGLALVVSFVIIIFVIVILVNLLLHTADPTPASTVPSVSSVPTSLHGNSDLPGNTDYPGRTFRHGHG